MKCHFGMIYLCVRARGELLREKNQFHYGNHRRAVLKILEEGADPSFAVPANPKPHCIQTKFFKVMR